MSVSRTRGPDPLDRRHLLRCAAVCGVAAPVLVGCGSDEPEPSGNGTDAGGGAGEILTPTSEVPVGSGVVLDDVIVAQPTEGEFVAFTTVCTHQGGKITSVDEKGVMTCSLHGSQFSIEGGENLVGPNGGEAGTTAALPEVEVTVEGDEVVRA